MCADPSPSHLPIRLRRLYHPGAYALGHLKVVNYYGSCAAALVFNNNRAGAKLDRVSASLVRHLHRESDEDLRRGMPFSVRFMTIVELYRYSTRHFDFHEQQLTLGDSETIECEAPYLFGGILSLPAADLWTSSITPLTAVTSNTPPWIRADPPGG